LPPACCFCLCLQTVIFLVTNKLSIVVLCNMAAVAIVSLAMATKAIFLGELKPAEVLVSQLFTATASTSMSRACLAHSHPHPRLQSHRPLATLSSAARL